MSAAGNPTRTRTCTDSNVLGLPATAGIAFEDSVPGAKAAVAANLFTVGVTTTMSPATLQAVGCQHTILNYLDPHLLDGFGL